MTMQGFILFIKSNKRWILNRKSFHLAYLSPDIAPSDYYLLRSIQHSVSKAYFQNETDVIKWVDDFIASRDETFFHHGICMLLERWQKIVDVNIKYFIKTIVLFLLR